MARRSKSLVESLLDLFASWPWYISLILAPITSITICTPGASRHSQYRFINKIFIEPTTL